MPRLHGIEPHETDVTLPLGERVGHTLVLGTTRVGKTRLAELFITQDIRRKIHGEHEVVIVFDPKGDADLLKRMYVEARRAGREGEMYVFHLGWPDISARYNAVGRFGRISEVATRIAGQLSGEGNSAAFREFAWRFVNIIARALVELGQRPDYLLIQRHVVNIDALFIEYAQHFFARTEPKAWEVIVQLEGRLNDKTIPRHMVGREKRVAEAIYGDEGALLRIDMSEYGERHTVARLVGAPPGYVGYDEGGQLTEKVRRKPYSVLLLDEIEKAHPDVYNILLQVFDDGRLTDGKGRVVDFTNTIIIATSNLGSDIIQRRLKARGAAGEEYEKTKTEVMEVLRGHFRPEFLNRIEEIIVFHALGKEEIRHIVGLQLDRVARNAASQGVTLSFDQSLIDHFAEEGYKPEFGARALKRLIRSELETALAREMLGGGIGKGDHVIARWDDKADRVGFERTEQPKNEVEADKPDEAKSDEGAKSNEGKGARKKKPASDPS